MPLYEYICTKCKKVFDRFLKIDERELPLSEPCPNCGEIGSIVRNFENNSNGLVDPIQLGRIKPPSDWRNFVTRLSKVKGASKNINTY